MNFRDELKTRVQKAEARRKVKKKRKWIKLHRTEEEWKVVEKYLERIFLEIAEESDGSGVLRIDTRDDRLHVPCKKGGSEYIMLSDGSRLVITYADIEKFCEKNNMKLTYCLDETGAYQETAYYTENHTKAFIIRV